MSLNQRQREVAESLEGVFIVDAGAGTGKTYTITERYINILKQKDVRALDILLVTFTRNASVSMKEKISSRVDLKFQSEMLDAPISSFDSFCSKIVLNHGISSPSYLGIGGTLSGYKVVTSRLILSSMFTEFFTNFSKRNSDKYFNFFTFLFGSGDLLALIDKLLSYGIYPTVDGWFLGSDAKLKGDLNTFLDEFGLFDKLGEGKRGPTQSELLSIFKGKVLNKKFLDLPLDIINGKQIGVEFGEISFNDKFKGEVIDFVYDVYFEFLKFMIDKNCVTYSMVSMFAFLVLYNDSSVRRKYSYDYVMVDEFQDTNEIQFMIMLLVMKKSNLCVVGDWKQGIYGFRNASISNISDFKNKLKFYSEKLNSDVLRILVDVDNVKSLYFDINYRSSQKVLDFSERALFVRGSQKEIVDINEIERLGLVSLNSHHIEYDSISEIGFYQMDTMDLEIDFIAKKISEIVGRKELKIWDEKLNMYVSRKVKFSDIAILSRTRSFALEVYSRLKNYGISCIYDGPVSVFSTEPAILLLAWMRLILRDDSREAWIPILEKESLNFSQIKHILESKDYPLELVNFKKRLLSRSNRIIFIIGEIFERYGFNDSNSNAILRILDDLFRSSLMSFSDLVLFIEKNILFDEMYNVDSDSVSDSVKIKTIHGSKGLEFGIVFVVNCNRSSFPSMAPSSSSLVFDEKFGLFCKKFFDEEKGFVFDSWKSELALSVRSKEYDEERRLLYTAITRARFDVYVTAYNPSQFFIDLSDGFEIGKFGDVLDSELQISDESSDELDNVCDDLEIQAEVSKRKIISAHDLMSFEKTNLGRGVDFGRKIHRLAFRYVKGLPISDVDSVLKSDFENVKKFLDSISEDVEKISEVSCVLPLFKRVIIRGIADLVLVYSDRIELIDYKTDLDRGNLIEYQKQLSVYFYVLSEVYDLPVKAFVFWTHEGELVEVKPFSKEALAGFC